LGNDLRSVPQQADRHRPPLRSGATYAFKCVSERIGTLVEVARREPPLDSRWVDLDAEDRRAGHRRRQGLRTTHPAEPRSQDRATAQVGTAEVSLSRSGERLVSALQDA